MLKQAAQVLLIVILCVLLVGFGVCGVSGIVGGVRSSMELGLRGGIPFVLFGLLGLGIAYICWIGIASLWRKPPPPKE